jgi:iron complex transport system substrate-binding protein
VALFAVGLLVAAGLAVTATAAYLELRPTGTGGPSSLTFTDDLGRTVTVPKNPDRVAVLSPSILDPMFRLGLRSHVVAVDCYAPAFGGLTADYSSDQVALWNLTGSMCVQVAPAFNFEALLNDTPQLVLASTLVTVAAVEEIESTYHIPVVMLQPPTLSGIEVDVTLLGDIFGRSAQAASLNGLLQEELAVAQGITTNLTNSGGTLPSVLVTYSANPVGSPSPGYYTFGPGSFGQSLIEVASAVSIAANATYPYPLLTGGQVLASDPAVIVYGTGFGLDESAYAQGPDWDQLTAVNAHTAYGMNSNFLTEPDPSMVLEGLPLLLHLLHPDLAPAP